MPGAPIFPTAGCAPTVAGGHRFGIATAPPNER
jgi:hypothetical protein